MANKEANPADSPMSLGSVRKWVEYFKGNRPLLASRDEKLKQIHHDASLTKEQKYEQSKALFEATNKLETFLKPARRLQWVRA